MISLIYVMKQNPLKRNTENGPGRNKKTASGIARKPDENTFTNGSDVTCAAFFQNIGVRRRLVGFLIG